MLLSIDRVLQLLAEGKTIEKIAQMADCAIDDVVQIIEETRKIITKYEKPISKKKIIIKKNSDKGKDEQDKESSEIYSIFTGAELSAVPIDSTLTIYAEGISNGNPGVSGIGIIILDKEDRQVGKVSAYTGHKTKLEAEYLSLIKSLKIANYFNTKKIRIRINSEILYKQINNQLKIKDDNIKKLFQIVMDLMKDMHNCHIESVTKEFNEKAVFLAQKGALNKNY